MTAAVDIYGLGAVLYKLLTGRAPFQAGSVYELLEQVCDRQPEPPRYYNRGIDRDLEAICLKCLEKEPSRRYHSAAALASDLELWRAGAAISARPPGPSGRASRWYRQNQRGVALSVALVGLVMIFVLTAVATATIICNYGLQDDTDRSAPAAVHRRRAGHSADEHRAQLPRSTRDAGRSTACAASRYARLETLWSGTRSHHERAGSPAFG